MEAGQYDKRLWLVPPVVTRNDAGETVVSYAIWNARTTYAAGDRVLCRDGQFRSLIGDNTGNEPADDGVKWITDEGLPLGHRVWARVFGATAREQVRDGLSSAAVPYSIRIRWSETAAAVTEKWCLLYAGKQMAISSAVEIGRQDAIDIVATELRE